MRATRNALMQAILQCDGAEFCKIRESAEPIGAVVVFIWGGKDEDLIAAIERHRAAGVWFEVICLDKMPSWTISLPPSRGWFRRLWESLPFVCRHGAIRLGDGR